MIDILTTFGDRNLKVKVEALANELQRIIEFESDGQIGAIKLKKLPEKYLSHFDNDLRQKLAEVYSKAYSLDKTKHPLIRKYFPGKSGGRGKKPGFADFFSGGGCVCLAFAKLQRSKACAAGRFFLLDFPACTAFRQAGLHTFCTALMRSFGRARSRQKV